MKIKNYLPQELFTLPSLAEIRTRFEPGTLTMIRSKSEYGGMHRPRRSLNPQQLWTVKNVYYFKLNSKKYIIFNFSKFLFFVALLVWTLVRGFYDKRTSKIQNFEKNLFFRIFNCTFLFAGSTFHHALYLIQFGQNHIHTKQNQRQLR